MSNAILPAGPSSPIANVTIRQNVGAFHARRVIALEPPRIRAANLPRIPRCRTILRLLLKLVPWKTECERQIALANADHHLRNAMTLMGNMGKKGLDFGQRGEIEVLLQNAQKEIARTVSSAGGMDSALRLAASVCFGQSSESPTDVLRGLWAMENAAPAIRGMHTLWLAARESFDGRLPREALAGQTSGFVHAHQLYSNHDDEAAGRGPLQLESLASAEPARPQQAKKALQKPLTTEDLLALVQTESMKEHLAGVDDSAWRHVVLDALATERFETLKDFDIREYAFSRLKQAGPNRWGGLRDCFVDIEPLVTEHRQAMAKARLHDSISFAFDLMGDPQPKKLESEEWETIVDEELQRMPGEDQPERKVAAPDDFIHRCIERLCPGIDRRIDTYAALKLRLADGMFASAKDVLWLDDPDLGSLPPGLKATSDMFQRMPYAFLEAARDTNPLPRLPKNATQELQSAFFGALAIAEYSKRQSLADQARELAQEVLSGALEAPQGCSHHEKRAYGVQETIVEFTRPNAIGEGGEELACEQRPEGQEFRHRATNEHKNEGDEDDRHSEAAQRRNAFGGNEAIPGDVLRRGERGDCDGLQIIGHSRDAGSSQRDPPQPTRELKSDYGVSADSCRRPSPRSIRRFLQANG